CAPDYDEFAYW
nr:immunoglobulin heavy chain junction region [Mus musculus]NSM06458.1 immunoglobulin heavy chain junction region [Mus musculus]NSM07574.1 immunoglobulin heavy chain junction region [Mus musculus]